MAGVDWSAIGNGVWDFANSEVGGTIIGGVAGGIGSAVTGGDSGYTTVPTGRSWSGSSGSSEGSSWSGTAGYMKPYTTGEGGIYPEAKNNYQDNMDQGYIGQTDRQQQINESTAGALQEHMGNSGSLEGDLGQANTFGDRYSNNTDPAVQNSMNQFLGGEIDTNTLDGMQQAATNRAMVGYGDAVQDAGNMFTQQIAPSIRSGAMLSGQYGGSRQGVAEGVAAGQLNTQLARNARDLGTASMDVGQGLYSDAYQQARDNQYGMTQFGAGYGLEQNAQNAGMEQTGLGLKDDAMSRYVAAQQGAYSAEGRNVSDAQGQQDFKWQQLANYMAAIQGQGQESTSQNSSSSHSSGGSESSSVIPGTGYNMLEGIGYGATIGQGIGGLDYTK